MEEATVCGVSEVQCNCRQSQPYLPVKNTIIPHRPRPGNFCCRCLLFLSVSLCLQLQPRGLFLSRTKTLPPAARRPQTLPLSSDRPSLSLHTPASRSLTLFHSRELQSGNEQAVNTHAHIHAYTHP